MSFAGLTSIHSTLFKKKEISNLKLTPKQEECFKFLLDDVTKEILYGGGKGGGKSHLGCMWLSIMSIAYPETLYFVGRKDLKDIKAYTVDSFRKVLKHLYLREGIDYEIKTQINPGIRFSNGSRIDFLKLMYLPSDPLFERFGSAQYTCGWVEEAGQIMSKAYENINVSIGRWKNKELNIIPKLLLTSNPKKNFLYKIFYKPHSKGELEASKAFVKALVGDNKHLSEEYTNRLKNIKDKVAKQRLLLGIWEYDAGDNSLVPYDNLLDLFTNRFSDNSRGCNYITADIALQGSDKFIIMVWQGYSVTHIYEYPKSDGKEVYENLISIAQHHKVPHSRITYDSDGVGGFLRGFMPYAKPFVNNGKVMKDPNNMYKAPNYLNLSSQCGFMLASDIEQGQIQIEAQLNEEQRSNIIEDLESSLKNGGVDSENKLRLIPKKEVKELLNRSPDYFDALKMRYIFDLF